MILTSFLLFKKTSNITIYSIHPMKLFLMLFYDVRPTQKLICSWGHDSGLGRKASSILKAMGLLKV